MKTVLDLVAEALAAQGYAGLFNADLGCACELNDLAPCGAVEGECEAGYKHMVTAEDIEADRYSHLDDAPSLSEVGRFWVIVGEKPKCREDTKNNAE